MRRLTSILCIGVSLLAGSAGQAQEAGSIRTAADVSRQEIPVMAVRSSGGSAVSGTFQAEEPFGPAPRIRFVEKHELVARNASGSSMEKIRKAPPASVQSLAGEYVLSWLTLSTGSFDGGSSVTVNPVTGTDSIEIARFWSGSPVKAKVDVATGNVTIPMQQLGEFTDLGKLYIAQVNQNATPNKTAQIEGTVDAAGNFSFTSWWGVFFTEGTNKDKLAAAYYNTQMARTNGTMTYTTSQGTVSYGVRISQPGANSLRVENFFNAGLGVDIELNRDRTAKIPTQVAMINSRGSWNTIKCVEFNSSGSLSKYQADIVTSQAAAGNNNTISWTDWSLLTDGYYAGHLLTGTLKADADFSYPSISVTDFEGQGTLANPYKISKLDDLILLADKVNGDTDYVGKYGVNTYTRTYINKYFELTADIDMAGYRFEAIGSTWRQRFAGVLDGKGHTIKNLYVKAGSDRYAGLFGWCDTVSELKNIVLDNPVVTSDYYNAASLVAFTMGDVRNITVNNPQITLNNGRTVSAGVAGIVMGKMENCTVNGGRILGGGYCGGIVGEVHGGIENCRANAVNVLNNGQNSPAGGVAGNIVYGNAKNLYATGYVQFSNYAPNVLGGVVGHIGACRLENSFFAGMVIGYNADAVIGGVAGTLQGGDMVNCYSAGRIQCYSRKTGGIIGAITRYVVSGSDVESKVSSCYTSATVQAETYLYDKTECREVIGNIIEGASPVLENIYYDKQVTNFYSTRFGATTAQLTSASGPSGFDASVWEFTAGNYPRIKDLKDTEAAMYSAAAVILPSGDNFRKVASDATLTPLGTTEFFFGVNGRLTKQGHYASIEGNTLKIGTKFGTDTLYVIYDQNKVQAFHMLSIAPVPFEGDGTADSPFKIRTKADLIALSDATTAQGQNFPETYFEMTNDIDLEYDEAFQGINTDASDAHNQFAGVFDGKGYTIHRMKFNRVSWTKAPTATAKGTVNTSKSYSYAGFIGRLATEGVLRNLTIADDADLTFYGTAGALVGYAYGRIENCRNYARVVGASCWIGGIAGYSMKESLIKDCYNAGDVTSGYSHAGGIVGVCYGSIENCANTGDIIIRDFTTNYAKQLHHAGGITGAGNGSIIRNSINYGTVYAPRDYAGGIAGSLEGSASTGIGKDEVYNCINVGEVYIGGKNAGTAPLLNRIGAIGGSAGTESAANTYWDAQLIPLRANGSENVEGMHGVETSALTSGKALENYSDTVWNFRSASYPALARYASEPKVEAARNVILSIKAGETAFNLRSDATLGNGATWRLAKSTDFSISGGVLKAPASVTAVVTDTLYATDKAGVVKPILIKSMPPVPVAGDGTAASPFLITSTDDWNNLAGYSMSTASDFDGQFVKVTSDLDFTDKDFTRFNNDGVTPMSATFDGDGHTVKGLALQMLANNSGAAFGTISRSGVLKNIVFDGTMSGAFTNTAAVVDKLYGTLDSVTSSVSVSSTKNYTAGIVGIAYEGSRLDKVVNKGNISGSGTYLAGVATQINSGVTLTDCGNEGIVHYSGSTAAANVAGISGRVLPSTFIRCYNKGILRAANYKTVGAIGGLVADAPGLAASPEYVFTDCWNEGNIGASHKLAGLVACPPTSSTTAKNAVFTLTGCYNKGNITSVSEKAVSSAPTAGLMTYYTAGTTLTDCWNEGVISSKKNVYAAGLLGSYANAGTEALPIVIKGCYNKGAIVADGNQGGGLVGYGTSYVMFEDCYNTADVSGNQMVGGIVSAFAGNNSVMRNCYNTGNVTAMAYRAGGLIAWGAPAGAVVENCWNTGDVKSISEIQSTTNTGASSIGGLAGASSARFVNCYNAGAVQGLAQVGGLVGTPTKAKTSFLHCYNAGMITAPADTCGSIVGVSTVDNGRVWTEGNSVDSCYYIDSNDCAFDIDSIGTPVSTTELAALSISTAFNGIDDYTFPVLDAGNENALFHAAQLIPGEGDALNSVTKPFHVGAPAAVAWTSDCPVLNFDGTDTWFSDAFKGTVTVTATAGDLVRTYELNVDVTSGIDGVDSGRRIVSAEYYTVAGLRVARPDHTDGQVYVVVVTYDDGSRQTLKISNQEVK